jgi:transaldolase/glucose-6-phosphate isomerase
MEMDTTSSLRQLATHGQSLWYDYISRELLDNGGFERLIRDDGIKGVTSNPAIFAKAVAGSDAYTAALQAAGMQGLTALEAYEKLVLADIRDAADCLRPVFERTARRDGYASLEVSPHLAYNAATTVQEARRLWRALDRPNVMIKVPATPAGLTAMGTLLTEGININVTLLFSLPVYRHVANIYVQALHQRAANGDDPSTVASVASFFVSRIDAAFDKLVDALIARGALHDVETDLNMLRGRVAIASAKVAYQSYQEIFAGDRWAALTARGASTQRLLWASTGVKNPAYADVRYVEELIGPDTVNTVPPETLEAFRDHGVAASCLGQDVDAARKIMETIRLLGMPLENITDRLLEDGVNIFIKAFDTLLAVVEQQRCAVSGELSLPPAARDAVVSGKP